MNLSSLSQTLPIMGQCMGIIFVVTFLMIGMIALMNRVFKK